MFHASEPSVAIQLNVTRRPYSFNADRPPSKRPEGEEATWHESLLGYVGGDPHVRDHAERSMAELAQRAGIKLDYDVQTNWQPVDSQRLMLYAGRFGKQEQFMSVLANKHFERRQSASHRATLLDTWEEVGLPRGDAEGFLNTDELKDYVWRSYGDTIRAKGIHAIPYFVFNGPGSDAGPFRSGKGEAVVVQGSADAPTFCALFKQMHAAAKL